MLKVKEEEEMEEEKEKLIIPGPSTFIMDSLCEVLTLRQVVGTRAPRPETAAAR